MSQDIKSIYICPTCLDGHPMNTVFLLHPQPGTIELDLSLGKKSHRIFIDILLQWRTRYGRMYQEIKPFFKNWMSINFIMAPLLTHDIQEYELFVEYLARASRDKVPSQLDRSQCIHYIQDQFDIDIRSVDEITNQQYFAGLIY